MPTSADIEDKETSHESHSERPGDAKASGDTAIREELRHLGREARDSVSRQFDQVQKKIEDEVGEHPLKFIAIAGAVGFALGLLWMGRR